MVTVKGQTSAILGVATVLALGGAWQLLVNLGLLNRSFISSPAEAGRALVEMARTGELWSDIWASAARAAAGFALGSAAGSLTGLATGRSRVAAATIGQVLRLTRGIPAIAIIPFVLLWLGLGEESKIIIVTWAVYFPVWINVHLGVLNVPYKYIWTARSLGARRTQLLISVVIPAAMPTIISGMRTGIGLAYVSLFGAEMAGGFAGVGYRIYSAYNVYRIDVMVADLVVLGALAAGMDLLFAKAIDLAFPWTNPTVETNTLSQQETRA